MIKIRRKCNAKR